MGTKAGILAHDEILKRLNNNEIFKEGTWIKDNIRTAAYDLRIARDFLIVPDDDYPQGKRYDKGEYRDEYITIKPGEYAFISTLEKLCIPWDLAANIGVKFSFPRKGVLVLTGLLVDPGFGLQKKNRKWVPKEDERLHLILSNVGHNNVVLKPGFDKIASIQFFTVVGKVKRVEVPSSNDMKKEFFVKSEKPKAGLSFFKEMSELKSKTEYFEERISSVENGTNQIVMFGVYLLCTSIIVGAISAILSMISAETFQNKMKALEEINQINWAGSLAISIVALSAGWIVSSGLKFIGKYFARGK